jgi:hypothetical protein
LFPKISKRARHLEKPLFVVEPITLPRYLGLPQNGVTIIRATFQVKGVMVMFEGLWIIQFAGMEGKGGGVAVLTKRRVLGGDGAFTYIGTYEESENAIRASIKVQNFAPGIGNVLGIKGDFQLDVTASLVNEGVMQGQGSTPSAPGFGLKVKLTRRAGLP